MAADAVAAGARGVLPTWPDPLSDLTPAAARAVRRAARIVYGEQRLDVGALAGELGVSRVTLHRWVGTREQLLGEALWLLGDNALALCVDRWERARAAGDASHEGIRSLAVMEDFRSTIAADPGLRHLLDAEPSVAIRLLTDPRGCIQPRLVCRQAEILQHDVEAGVLAPLVDVDTLSYAAVRLGESFLYADVLASRVPDLDACTALINALFTASAP
ncbi:QsdR family transcriptional regulator [Nocardioides pacificus]